MPTPKLTISQLAELTCDSLTDVLDQYRRQNPTSYHSEEPSTIHQLKGLHASLERLEKAAKVLDRDGAILDEGRKRNIEVTLDDCGTLANTIRVQIERGTLIRPHSNITRDVEGLIRAVDLASEGWVTDSEDEPYGDPVDNCGNLADGDQDDDDIISAAGTLHSLFNDTDSIENYKQQNNLLTEKYLRLQKSDKAKLDHIRILHQAIRSVNKVCPPQSEESSWDTLSSELQKLLTELQEIHRTLQHLGSKVTSPISPTSSSRTLDSKSPSRPNRTRSETNPLPSTSKSTIDVNLPKQFGSNTSSSTTRQTSSFSRPTYRPPSPTESNVSSMLPKLKKKSNAGSKRSSTGSSGLPFKINR